MPARPVILRKRRAASGASPNGPGAIVIGGDYQGLGIVRSLGRHGTPVCVIDDEKSIARFSRYATYSVSARSLRGERETVDTLLSVGRKFGLKGWVLYPTRDETVAALARNREELSQTFRVPTPDWDKVNWSWDKRNTYRLANELGIPAPRTWLIESAGDLDQIDSDPPYAIKPAIKERFFYATRAKAWRANSRSELRALFLRAKDIAGPGEILVQDIIPGDGHHQFAYCAFFKSGQAIASMAACRRRQHPPEFGRASTFVETVDLPILEELSERFLREIDYYGLVEIEYKLDPRDGKYRLLDFNARTWGYHTLGYAAGVDFPYLLFADQTGKIVDPCRAKPGVRWVRLATDLPAAILDIVHSRENWRTYLRSVTNADVEAVFSREDPLAGLAELMLLPYLAFKRGF